MKAENDSTSIGLPSKTYKILLADDDQDDALFFRQALDDLQICSCFKVVQDGEELMKLLHLKKDQPDILFLDLNMPCKNGFECLKEIRQNNHFKTLQIIILSTSFEMKLVQKLFRNGAQHYVQKPADFSELKRVIAYAIRLCIQVDCGELVKNAETTGKDFIIYPKTCSNEFN